ncbi:MAG: nickel-dependent hydrogenase large subunit [Ignavibacteriales bacterium]|nr:nickel-dependent hydrogenase large subunit [Ignavibacteriales bacterium]
MGNPVEQTLYFHYARLIEVTVRHRERVRSTAAMIPIFSSTDILNTEKDYKGEGVGILEAPRGTLFHHYKADETGKLTAVNLIVATRPQQLGDDRSGRQCREDVYHGRHCREGMLNRVEAAVRAHDPCLSCSTHAVGQMPIQIEVLDPRGEALQTITRE